MFKINTPRNVRLCHCHFILTCCSAMAWIPEERFTYSWLDSLLLRVLKCGQIPRHVAFIMDGNRRFARQKKIDKIEGHTMGFEKLAETLQWCHDMQIREVTVYAFRYVNSVIVVRFFQQLNIEDCQIVA